MNAAADMQPGEVVTVTIAPTNASKDSSAWVALLQTTYVAWGRRHGYSVDVAVGPSEVRLTLVAPKGALFLEHGTHRLIRVSPFDEMRRRTTSHAVVHVEGRSAEDARQVVRVYVMDPYKMVKNLGTDRETADVEAGSGRRTGAGAVTRRGFLGRLLGAG